MTEKRKVKITAKQLHTLEVFWTMLWRLQIDTGWDECTTRVNLNKRPPFLFGGVR